jgi:hypothetical protein
MSTKHRPVLLAKYPEPPVKKVKCERKKEENMEEEENEENDDDQDEDSTEYTECSDVEKVKEIKKVNDQKIHKQHSSDGLPIIPSAQDVKKQWKDALEVERANFMKELAHNFDRNVKNYSSSFVVCYDVKYKWQHNCIEQLFKPKGYDVVYKNVRDYDEDRTFAELRVPGTLDTRQLFRV